MSNWNSVPEMQRSVRSSVLKIAGALIAIALMGRQLGIAFGLAIGTCLSLWQFSQIINSVAKILQKPKAQAQVHAASSYVMRYLIIAGMLALVYFTEEINFFATFIGLLMVKIVIIGWAIRQALREGGAAYLRQLIRTPSRRGGD